MVKISIGILQALYDQSSKYSVLFDYLSERERNYRETKPETFILRLRERGIELDRQEMIRFFRGLENAGCGRYVEGRWGHASRFEWAARMSDVGRAARREQTDVETLHEGELAEEPREDGAVADDKRPTGDLIAHEFYLRPGFFLRVELPNDLRRTEAERISDWVKTLPFE